MSVAADRYAILSLGAGVQSTTLALMVLRGDLPTSYARPVAAVFADTGFEPRRVYQHLLWLTQTLGDELPVHIVHAMRPDGTPAHIREDTEAIVRGETTRLANPPVFVKESIELHPFPAPRTPGQIRGLSDATGRDLPLRDYAALRARIHRSQTGHAAPAVYGRFYME
jgi:hypothetical protein